MTRRERAAQRRALDALIAAAELEHTFGEFPAAGSDLMAELRAAARGLHQVVLGRGRRG